MKRSSILGIFFLRMSESAPENCYAVGERACFFARSAKLAGKFYNSQLHSVQAPGAGSYLCYTGAVTATTLMTAERGRGGASSSPRLCMSPTPSAHHFQATIAREGGGEIS